MNFCKRSFEQFSILALILLEFICSISFAQEAGVAATVDFQRDVAPLFDQRCAGCHTGDHAKAGLQIEDRDTVLGYIEPGDPENSILWSDYLNGESPVHNPATSVMPMSGPMPQSELTVMKTWIEEGAAWPEGIKFVSFGGIPDGIEPDMKPKGIFSRLSGFLGYFHPAVVHFPIALLMFGGGAAALSFFTGGRAQYVAFYCLLWGTLAAAASSVLGWCYADEKGYPAWSVVPNAQSLDAAAAVFRHRWLGTATTVLSVIVLALALIAKKRPKSKLKHFWRIGLVLVALLVSIVGHQGGELVYGDILHRAIDRLIGS